MINSILVSDYERYTWVYYVMGLVFWIHVLEEDKKKACPCVRMCLVLLRQCGELSSRGLSWSLYHEALVSIPPDFANREILKRQPNSLIEINNTDNTLKNILILLFNIF